VAAANQMSENDSIGGMEALVVPVPPAPAVTTRMTLYTARKGDTLVTIADRFGVSLTQLRRWNKVSGIKVEAGRKLRVAEPVMPPRTSSKHRHGAVARGATTHEAAPEKSSSEKSSRPAARKKSTTSSAGEKHAQGSKAAAGAGKSGTRSIKGAHATKPAAHSSSPARKQK
jgi:membrane-bound lytic murein transglycosylase D